MHTLRLVLMIALVALTSIGLVLVGRSFSADCADPCAATQGYQGCLNATNFAGVALLVFAGPGAVFR